MSLFGFQNKNNDDGTTLGELDWRVQCIENEIGDSDYLMVNSLHIRIDQIHKRLTALEDHLGVEHKKHSNDIYYEPVEDDDEE